MKFRFYLFIIFLFPMAAISQNINGTIVNEKGKAIPYATIFVKESMEGTATNVHGKFSLNLPKGSYHIVARSLGYHQFEDELIVSQEKQEIKITLQTSNYQLNEVKVFPGNEDPAYYIIRNAINKAPQHRQEVKSYEANLYIKSNFVFKNIPRFMKKRVEINDKKMGDVLKEDKTYVIESVDKITYQFPNHYKQENISKKSSLTGFDEPPVMGLFTASFYEERPENVISPLSALALNHYKYRYEGYKKVGDFDIFKIKVTPRRKSDELISGYLYIVDKIWSIYSIDFDMSIKVVSFRLKQQYEMVHKNIWLPISNTIKGKFSFLGLKARYFYGSSLKYANVVPNNSIYTNKSASIKNLPTPKTNAKIEYLKKKIDKITATKKLKNRDVRKIARLNRKILKQQYKDSLIVEPKGLNYEIIENKDTIKQNGQYWDSIRTIPLTSEEISSYVVSDSLKVIAKDTTISNTSKNKESLFSKIVSGKTWYNSDSTTTVKYNGLLDPTNSNYNAVDGISYFQGIELKFKLDSTKSIYLNNKVGYAFHRKAWFWEVNSNFNNLFFKGNNLNIAAGKNSFDFKEESNSISQTLNSISTFFFAKNYKKLYESTYLKALIRQKVKKGFYLYGGVRHDQFARLYNNTRYVFNKKKHFESNIPYTDNLSPLNIQDQKSFLYLIGASYYKRQRKPWLESSNFLMISDYFNISAEFTQGIKNVFDSDSDFSLLDIKFNQQANLTPTSGILWQLNAGIFFNNEQMHFSQFKHFKSAESPVIFKSFQNSFQLLDDYALSTKDFYVNLGAEYRTEFLALRYLSLINKNAWSESLYINHLYSDINNYTEIGYSLNNVFLLGNIGIFAGFNKLKHNSLGVKLSIALQ